MSISQLANIIPSGGWMAVENAKNSDEIYDALFELSDYSFEDYCTLDADILYRVYETAEDVNYHTVAGKAFNAHIVKR